MVKYGLRGTAAVSINFGEAPLASVLAALPERDDDYDASVPSPHRHRDTAPRSLAARRVVAPVPCPPPHYERKVGGTNDKPIEMRRVGDDCAVLRLAERRPPASRIRTCDRPVGWAIARRREARLAPPRREAAYERKAGGAPRKRPKYVEGATQKQNGKWSCPLMFPGREFDDLDAYRAAKKQRYARREEYRAQARENKGLRVNG